MIIAFFKNVAMIGDSNIFCCQKKGDFCKKEVLRMKYIRQFLIILLISFLGEVLKIVLPLPIPASIYGLLLMFAALELGIIKLDSVRETGKFLIEIMPMMFIPAGVGLLEAWGKLSPVILPVVVTVAVSTVVVMGVSGRVTQSVIRMEKRNKE